MLGNRQQNKLPVCSQFKDMLTSTLIGKSNKCATIIQHVFNTPCL